MNFFYLLFSLSLFTVSVSAQNYCSSSANFTTFEWIEKVQIANIIHQSGENNGYADFTNYTANVFRGAPVTLRLTPGISMNNQTAHEYWRVWIDYNHDGDFSDPNELVFSTDAEGDAMLQTNIDIPYSSTPGVTRMRITMKFVNEDNIEPSPCDDFLYGEVEDYSVNLQTPPTADNVIAIDKDIAYYSYETGELNIKNPFDFKLLQLYNLNGQLIYKTDRLLQKTQLPKNQAIGIVVLTDLNNQAYAKKLPIIK